MILEALLVAVVSGAPGASAGPTKPPGSRSARTPPTVSVESDRFDIEGKKKDATFSGHVRVHRGTTKLTCDRLIAHYSDAQEITRIECVGHVEALDGDKWAKGDRAEFDNATGILELTGSPEARQGPNHMAGSKVVFDVERNTISVTDAKVDVVSPTQEPKKASGTPPRKPKTP